MLCNVVLVISLLAAVAGKEAENVVKKARLPLINSETKPGNLLPNFLFMQGSIEVRRLILFNFSFVICNTRGEAWGSILEEAEGKRKALPQMTRAETIFLKVQWRICVRHSFHI